MYKDKELTLSRDFFQGKGVWQLILLPSDLLG
jgi:hypothetical protein